MPCVSCRHWLPPHHPRAGHKGQSAAAGRCNLDQNLAHPHYHCVRHESAAANLDAGGMTDDEITWLRLNAWSPAAQELIPLWRNCESRPLDEDVRARFSTALRRWRDRRIGFQTRMSRPAVVSHSDMDNINT